MKKVYICSPVRGDYINNIALGKLRARWAFNTKNVLPICVHGYLEEITGLSEDNGDRALLLFLGIQMLELCDECWVFGKKISEGMRKEIEYCKFKKIKVKYISY